MIVTSRPQSAIGNPSHVVVVSRPSQFPGAVGGFIDLPPGVPFKIEGDVTVPVDTILRPGVDGKVFGDGRSLTKLRGDVAGPLIQAPLLGDAQTIEGLSLFQSDPLGSMIGASDTTLDRLLVADCELFLNGGDAITAGANRFEMRSTTINGCARALAPNRGGFNFIVDGSAMLQSVGGSGNGLIDLGSNVWTNLVRLDNFTALSSAGGGSLRALGDANLSGNGRAIVSDAGLIGPGFRLAGGVTLDDLRWDFEDMRGIKDSMVVGGLTLVTPVPTTFTVPGQGVFTKLLGTTTGLDERRVSASSNGILTLNELDGASCDAEFTVSATKSGGSVLYSFQVFVDGAPVGGSVAMSVSNTVQSIFVAAPVELDEGQEVDVYVRNDESTAALTATTINGKLKA